MLIICVSWSELGENGASEVIGLPEYDTTTLVGFYGDINNCTIYTCQTFFFLKKKDATNYAIETGKLKNQLSNIINLLV